MMMMMKSGSRQHTISPKESRAERKPFRSVHASIDFSTERTNRPNQPTNQHPFISPLLFSFCANGYQNKTVRLLLRTCVAFRSPDFGMNTLMLRIKNVGTRGHPLTRLWQTLFS